MLAIIIYYYYVIAGPPLAPNVSFVIINATAVQVSWERPFSMKQFDIHNYTVRIRNSTNGKVSEEVILADNDQTYSQPSPVISYIMNNNGDIPHDCHELQFNVTASNAVGESNEGYVSGGFPIGESVYYTITCKLLFKQISIQCLIIIVLRYLLLEKICCTFSN